MSSLQGIWRRIQAGLRCGGCDRHVDAGEAVYFTKAGHPRCATCVKRLWAEDPPVDLAPAPPLKLQPPPFRGQPSLDFARFDRAGVAEVVRTNILDARQRQAGERDAD